MNFTILTPNDSPLQNNKSEPTASNYGGHREYSQVANSKDYTNRTTENPTKKENPVDDTTRDIDDMTDDKARKREFSRREETSNVQKSNEFNISKSDSDKRPPEDTDPFIPDPDDPNFLIKMRRSKLKGHFGDGQYDNPHGAYEGEVS